ncbi:MAG: cyclic nucleotide-binding domain-containing protein, partial [Lentisphaerae bacterium]
MEPIDLPPNIDFNLLQNSPFLRLIPADQLPGLLKRCQIIRYNFGEIIVNEGDPADAFFLILSERARVLKKTAEGTEVPFQRMRKGESFG